MIWKILSSSVTGTSHTSRDEKGQDTCRAGVLEFDGQEFFIGLAADGAGSTAHGGTGAVIACSTACRAIAGTIRDHDGDLSSITRSDIEGWVGASRNAVGQESKENGRPVREYACTLLGAVIGNAQALFFQIGDGGIVIRKDEGYHVIFWPEQGEYANTTYFLTDDAFPDHLKIMQQQGRVDEAAIFTDGLQNLVLSFPSKTVHYGFFHPLFQAIRDTPDEAFAVLRERFTAFLEQDEIKNRNDDDKTLVLAVRKADMQ